MMFEIGSDRWPGISKLTEEAGEVLQVCGKLIGSQGIVEHWDGTNLKGELTNEIGDLLAAIQFVVAHCDLNPHEVALRADQKLARFERWHEEQTAKALKPRVEWECSPGTICVHEIQCPRTGRERIVMRWEYFKHDGIGLQYVRCVDCGYETEAGSNAMGIHDGPNSACRPQL